jgi:hypothetical protein
MLANKLKLNDEKTEVLVVSRKCDASKVEGVRICIGEATITPKPVVKNLGAQFDQHLTMVPQVLDVKKRAYYHLRNIVHIRPYLSDMACARAIHATVTSRLDFNNALLLGIPKAHINQLQVLHNSAARVLTKTPQRQHISPVLARLHWLPVDARIHYKALSMVHAAVHSPSAPPYMKDMCSFYQPARPLRSQNDTVTLVCAQPSNMHGTRSFKSCAFRLWNDLPLNLRIIPEAATFKKRLKTYLFNQVYN